MSRQEEYLAKLAEARREVARVADPEVRAVWQKIADGWADMARQAYALDVDLTRAEPRPGKALLDDCFANPIADQDGNAKVDRVA